MNRLIVSVLLLTACSEESTTHVWRDCVKRDSDKVVDCMIRCAEAANPKSDEEGEDLVAQCEASCERQSACLEYVWRYRINNLDNAKTCSSAPANIQQLCKQSGWKP